MGGLLTLLEKIKVKNIIISKQGKDSANLQKLLTLIKKLKTNVIKVKAGDKIQIDKNSYFKILFPQDDLISQNILNNNSIVAKFCYQKNLKTNPFTILFTGDIEEIAENRLVELYLGTTELKADILKVAHHGSKSSSTQSFIEMVKPKIALIGVGENNHFGHPNDGVLERLKVIGTRIYRTDRSGEIILNLDYKGRVRIKEFIE